MKTGSHLKIKNFGTDMMGVELEGNPKKPEPGEFIVYFPGGATYVTRCTNGDYWVHILALESDTSSGDRRDGRQQGKVIETRADFKSGPILDITPDVPNGAVHLAIRITTKVEDVENS